MAWPLLCHAGMNLTADIERNVARCRTILSMVAIVVVFVDPTQPTALPGLPAPEPGTRIDPWALGIMVAHLAYSVVVAAIVGRPVVSAGVLSLATTWADVAFGAAIVTFTEGTASPFWAFFVFAVIAAGAHGNFRRSMAVTFVSAAIYLGLVVLAWQGHRNFYLMRPVYLVMVGYLTAYLGQRLTVQAQAHQLEAARQRTRIARALHDGCVQTLGGVNLTLEICKELVAAGRSHDALAQLGQLQGNLNREHDELRTWVRELAEVEPGRAAVRRRLDTRVVVTADFGGSPAFVDQVLQIVREAVTNVKRHASAETAVVSIRAADTQVLIAVDDDGVGFADVDQVPWSMSSRVTDAGGSIRVVRDGSPGAHLRLALPEA
jgi:signal transduction histidine kinase